MVALGLTLVLMQVYNHADVLCTAVHPFHCCMLQDCLGFIAVLLVFSCRAHLSHCEFVCIIMALGISPAMCGLGASCANFENLLLKIRLRYRCAADLIAIMPDPDWCQLVDSGSSSTVQQKELQL